MRYDHLPPEERSDWILFKHHGSQMARMRLVTLYARKHDDLAIWIYRKVLPFLPPHEMEDGIQAARMFLVDAVDKYNIDHPKQPRFSTFATHHISGSLRKYASRTLRRPPREVNSVPYEDLCAGHDDGARLPQEMISQGMENPVISRMLLEDIDRRARDAFTTVEYQCYRIRFIMQRSVRSVERELGLASYAEARTLVRRVQRRLKPLVEAAGLVGS